MCVCARPTCSHRAQVSRHRDGMGMIELVVRRGWLLVLRESGDFEAQRQYAPPALHMAAAALFVNFCVRATPLLLQMWPTKPLHWALLPPPNQSHAL